MRIKHVSNEVIGKADKAILVGFLRESFESIEDCVNLITSINNTRLGKMDDDDLLEIFDDPYFVRTENIEIYSSCALSTYDGINFCMKDIYATIQNLSDNIKKINSLGVYLNEEWQNIVYNQASAVIGGLTHTIWFDFNLESYQKQIEIDHKGVDAEIDEIFYEYCDELSLNPINVVENVRDFRIEYKYKIRLFDEYPEYEEVFESLMGPHIAGVEEEYLTIQMVLDLQNGLKTPMEICEECYKLATDTDNFE